MLNYLEVYFFAYEFFIAATLEPPTIDYNDKIDENFSPEKTNLLPQSTSF